MHTSTFYTKFITNFVKFPDSPYQVHFGGVPHPRLHCPLLLGHILMPSFCPRWHFYPSLPSWDLKQSPFSFLPTLPSLPPEWHFARQARRRSVETPLVEMSANFNRRVVRDQVSDKIIARLAHDWWNNSCQVKSKCHPALNSSKKTHKQCWIGRGCTVLLQLLGANF